MVANTFKLLAGSIPNPRGVRKKSGFAKDKVPCCRIWPNGEFGLSWHKKEEELESAPGPMAGGVSVERVRLTCLTQRLETEYLKAVVRVLLLPWLVKSAKSAQPPTTYGRKGLTGYGAKVVRNGAHLMQRKYGKGRLAFITFTLPRLERGDAVKVAGDWSYLMKVLLQALKRLLAKQSLPSSIVLVTEIQPQRLSDGDLGALHVHLVLVGRAKGKTWAYSPFVYKAIWLRLLSNLLGKPLDCYPCENVERVKVDAANYLSKYMTKGSADIEKYAEIEGWEYVPRQWWTATQSVKKAVKKYTISGERAGIILDALCHQYWKNGGIPNSWGCIFVRPITIEGSKFQDIVIGMFGKIDSSTYEDIRGLVVSEH